MRCYFDAKKNEIGCKAAVQCLGGQDLKRINHIMKETLRWELRKFFA